MKSSSICFFPLLPMLLVSYLRILRTLQNTPSELICWQFHINILMKPKALKGGYFLYQIFQHCRLSEMGFWGHFLFSCIRLVILSFSKSFLSIYSGSVLDQVNQMSAPLSRRAPPHLLAGLLGEGIGGAQSPGNHLRFLLCSKVSSNPRLTLNRIVTLAFSGQDAKKGKQGESGPSHLLHTWNPAQPEVHLRKCSTGLAALGSPGAAHRDEQGLAFAAVPEEATATQVLPKALSRHFCWNVCSEKLCFYPGTGLFSLSVKRAACNPLWFIFLGLQQWFSTARQTHLRVI